MGSRAGVNVADPRTALSEEEDDKTNTVSLFSDRTGTD